MKNRLGYLGLLGLCGVLGFAAHNYAYFGFFGFLYFFRYFAVIPDELFKENVKQAATPAFFVGMVIYVLTAGLSVFHISTLIFTTGLVLGFAFPFLIFTIILVHSELRESLGK